MGCSLSTHLGSKSHRFVTPCCIASRRLAALRSSLVDELLSARQGQDWKAVMAFAHSMGRSSLKDGANLASICGWSKLSGQTGLFISTNVVIGRATPKRPNDSTCPPASLPHEWAAWWCLGVQNGQHSSRKPFSPKSRRDEIQQNITQYMYIRESIKNRPLQETNLRMSVLPERCFVHHKTI